ncbi:MAG: hypothetical protein KGL39_33425 [Patescibacteria group bacterium]|nr:hypothetical protein [Patescibacteria group bacterium]
MMAEDTAIPAPVAEAVPVAEAAPKETLVQKIEAEITLLEGEARARIDALFAALKAHL